MSRSCSSLIPSVFMVMIAGAFSATAQAGTSLLYAPSNADNPTFRQEVAALIGGPVDYFNGITGTPTLDVMLQYDCVMVWCNYPVHDPLAYGDRLADYVDAGGRVILGQWSSEGFRVSPEIYPRILFPQYCPVTISSFSRGAYAGDGLDCIYSGVVSFSTEYMDVVTALNPGAASDGTFSPRGNPAVAWRADRQVYYSPGNTGGTYSAGDWARLTANMCTCGDAMMGDLNCDARVDAFDIDPFVLALTSPADYAAQFADCDPMLADCNGDGVVNVFDIDPFVQLLVGSR